MFTLECDKCGGMMIPDEKLTIDFYMKDMNYVMDNFGEIQEASVQQYLIYKCSFCGFIHRFTYKEWERLIRIKSSKIALKLRKQQMFSRDINKESIDPDNGLEYCGQCDGVDGEGNCFVDLINQCTIRKK